MTRRARVPRTSRITVRVPIVDLARVKRETRRLAPLCLQEADVIRMALAMGLSTVEKLRVPKPRRVRYRVTSAKAKWHR
jgi:hypothetical protein